MALTNKTIASTYGDILQADNSGSGRTANGTTIKDGLGNSTALTLGQNKLHVKPSSDQTDAVVIETSGGTDLLVVDSTNSAIKLGTSQSYANTQYLRFSANDIDVDSGTHIGVPVSGQTANAVVTFGTSANPAVPTQTVTADDWIHYIHYVDTNISVDSVQVLVGATAATGDSLNFHLCSLRTTDTTTVDAWSGITVVADDSGTTNAGYEQFYKVGLTVQSADVDAGDYLALTIEGNGTNSDYSVNALVRYHLR